MFMTNVCLLGSAARLVSNRKSLASHAVEGRGLALPSRETVARGSTDWDQGLAAGRSESRK